MENPATWGKAEHVVNAALEEWMKTQEAGVCGASLTITVTNALRQEGLLKEQEVPESL